MSLPLQGFRAPTCQWEQILSLLKSWDMVHSPSLVCEKDINALLILFGLRQLPMSMDKKYTFLSLLETGTKTHLWVSAKDVNALVIFWKCGQIDWLLKNIYRYTNMHADYSGQGFDQLLDVIDKIKNNPDDRRILLSAWNPSDLKQMALPPCHMFAQVLFLYF